MTAALGQRWPHHSDVVHDGDFELPVHEGFIWVGDFVVQHKLWEGTNGRWTMIFCLLKWRRSNANAVVLCVCGASLRYPERAPLSVLKHSKHPLVQLHRAVELGQVGVVDLFELGEKKKSSSTLKSPHDDAFECQPVLLPHSALSSESCWSLLLSVSAPSGSQSVEGWISHDQPQHGERNEILHVACGYLLVVECTSDLEIGLLPFIFDLGRKTVSLKKSLAERSLNCLCPWERHSTLKLLPTNGLHCKVLASGAWMCAWTSEWKAIVNCIAVL